MKFSIVMPVFNGEKYIKAALDSIFDQDYGPIEVIVMDGGSKDRTLDIVSQYPQVVCFSGKDKGQSDALNKGFAKATGDIYAWHNADDVYLPGAFRQIAQAFEQYPQADVVYGDYQIIDHAGRKICDAWSRPWDNWLFSHGRFCPVQPTIFWRKHVHQALAPLDEALHYCMDVDFYARAAQRFRFQHIPYRTGQFRAHQDSKTQNPENEKAHRAEYKQVLAKHFAHGPLDGVLFELFQFRSKITSFINRKIIGPLRQ